MVKLDKLLKIVWALSDGFGSVRFERQKEDGLVLPGVRVVLVGVYRDETAFDDSTNEDAINVALKAVCADVGKMSMSKRKSVEAILREYDAP